MEVANAELDFVTGEIEEPEDWLADIVVDAGLRVAITIGDPDQTELLTASVATLTRAAVFSMAMTAVASAQSPELEVLLSSDPEETDPILQLDRALGPGITSLDVTIGNPDERLLTQQQTDTLNLNVYLPAVQSPGGR